MPPEDEVDLTSGLDMDAAVADIATAMGVKPEGQDPADNAGDPADGKTAPSPAEAEGGAAPASADTSATTETLAPVDPAAAPPDTWTKEAKELWKDVPEPLKAEIRRRESDIARHVSEANTIVEQAQGKVQVADALEKMLQPYGNILQRFNINPWQHISHLLESHATLVFGTPEQKVSMIRNLASNIGLDLANLPAPGEARVNPLEGQVRALQQEVARLNGGVTSVTSEIQSARAAELEQGILAFMQDPAHPFFTEVANDIPTLFQTGAARTLQEAYDLAVLKNPVTRVKQIQMDSKVLAEKAAKAAADKAAAARKATGANVASRRAGRVAPPGETIDDTLKHTLAEINARP